MYLPRLFLITLLIANTGCQSYKANVAPPTDEIWLSATEFNEKVADITSPEEIFALSEHTKQQLRYITNAKSIMPERTKAVINFILQLADSDLVYQHSATTTAEQTLANGNANCLSLAILTYSIATELGLEAQFQDVQIPEYWTSQNNTTWLNGHVNLRIKQSLIADTASSSVSFGTDIIVDFDPFVLKKMFPSKIVKKERIVAMFYNNKAAEAFSAGNTALAYRYYQASAAADPGFAATWSNLAVLYRQSGFYEHAERAYLYSLQLNPLSLNTMANLALLYKHTNNLAAADHLQQKVINKRQHNPYYFVMMGDESLRFENYDQARKYYSQAIKLDNKIHEAYFGIAQTHYAQNEPKQAEYYLRKAKRHTPSDTEQQRYQNKINVLQQVAKNH